MPIIKTFKILSKEKYEFTSNDGGKFFKHRYTTDSDVLEIFPDWLEEGKSYEFEQVIAIDKKTGQQIKRKDGGPIYNWDYLGEVIEGEAIDKIINLDKVEDNVCNLQLDEIFKRLDLIDKGIVEILEKIGDPKYRNED